MAVTTLPVASVTPAGQTITIHNHKNEITTVQATSGDFVLIPGRPQIFLDPYTSVSLASNGDDGWYLVSGNPSREMTWKGAYDPNATDPAGDPLQYFIGDVVTDEGWTCVCNTDFTDTRPAPQPVGNEYWVSQLGDPPSFVDQSENTAYLWVGQRYTLPQDAWGRAVRIWLPDVVGNATQELWIVKSPTTTPVYTQVISPQEQDGNERWFTLERGLSPIVNGAIFDLVMIYSGTSGQTQWAGYWQQKNQGGNASEGECNFHGGSQTTISFNNVDKNVDNWATELDATPIGATLQAAGRTWTIVGKTPYAGGMNFDVEPGGQRPGEGERTYAFTYSSPIPIEYDRIDNYFGGNADVRGFQSAVSYADAVANLNDHAYGVDFRVQDVALNPAWDIMAYSG